MTFVPPYDQLWTNKDNSEWSAAWAYTNQYAFIDSRLANPAYTHPATPVVLQVTIGPGDQPGVGGASGTYSALWADFKNGHHPTQGDSFYIATAFYFPSSANNGGTVDSGMLIHEWHHTSPFDGVFQPPNGDVGEIAPHAFIVHAPDARWTGSAFTSSGVDTSTKGLSLRIAAGNIVPGSPASQCTDQPQIVIPGLQPTPMDQWICIIGKYTITTASTGTVTLWVAKKNKALLTSADFSATDFVEAVPTLGPITAHTLDYNSNTGAVDAMNLQVGLYSGDTSPPVRTTVIHTGSFIRTTFADAVSALTKARTGDITSGSPDVLNATGFWDVHDQISGTGIPAGTTVLAWVQGDNNTYSLTMSANATVTAVGTPLGWAPASGSPPPPPPPPPTSVTATSNVLGPVGTVVAPTVSQVSNVVGPVVATPIPDPVEPPAPPPPPPSGETDTVASWAALLKEVKVAADDISVATDRWLKGHGF